MANLLSSEAAPSRNGTLYTIISHLSSMYSIRDYDIESSEPLLREWFLTVDQDTTHVLRHKCPNIFILKEQSETERVCNREGERKTVRV